MKKLLTLFLALTMVFSLSLPVFAGGETKGTLSLTSEVTAEAGTTATLAVSVANNPGVAALRIQIDYDKTALELIGAENGKLMDGVFMPNLETGKLLFETASGSNTTLNGELCKLTFRIKDTAEAKSYPIGFTFSDASTAAAERVYFDTVGGNIKVEAFDANKPRLVSVGGVPVSKSTFSLPAAFLGKSYGPLKLEVEGGGTITVRIKSAESGVYGCLPEGLVFDSETLEISGTPTKKYSDCVISIVVENEYGSSSYSAAIKIFEESDKPAITTATLPKGYVGSRYYGKIDFTGSFNAATASVISGALPEGFKVFRESSYVVVDGDVTAAMAGKTYNFTIEVDNGAGKASKAYTLEIANEVVAPEIITYLKPLGMDAEHPNGVFPIVGKPFRLQLEFTGTNTSANPVEFFVYDRSGNVPETISDKYDLGCGLFLTKSGLIYSDNVLPKEGQAEGTESQLTLPRIGARNKSADGSWNDTGYNSGYAYVQIVYGYVIYSVKISPENAEVPQGGKQQFTVTIDGVGDYDDTVTWSLFGARDADTKIDETGLLTVGANETSTWLQVYAKCNGRDYSVPVTITSHTHITSLVEAKPKTCTENGMKQHYKCTLCGKTFSDAAATTEMTDVVIPADHNYGDLIAENPSTCIAEGMKEHFECSACHKLFNVHKVEVTAETLTIAKSTHVASTGYGTVPATCVSTGTKAYSVCSACGKKIDSVTLLEVSDDDLFIPIDPDAHFLEIAWMGVAEGHYHKCKNTGCPVGHGAIEAHIPGAAATETTPQTCTTCGYVIKAALGHTHNFNQKNTSETYLKSAATCTKKAVYYYSCSCGVKGTDTFESGETAPHSYLTEWSSDGTNHWHKCANCDATADKAAHADANKDHKCDTCSKVISECADANKDHNCDTCGKKLTDHTGGTATCKEKATCTICGQKYGELAAHNYKTEWSKDKNKHWHECSVCGNKKDEAAHTPGAAATETTPQVCTTCNYEITPASGHTHSFTRKSTDAKYLKSAATCTKKAVYYYSCSCGVTGTATFESGELAAHTYKTEWSKDSTKHWHECSVCGNKKDEAVHTPGAAATETTPQTCTACGYVIKEATGHVHSYTEKNTDAKYLKSAATCTAKAVYYYSCSCGEKGTETFESGETLAHTWETKWANNDSKHWHECTVCKTKGDEADHAFEWKIDKEATVTEAGAKHEECKVCGYKKATVAIDKLAPSIIDGRNAKWNKSGENNLTFKSDAAFSDFVEVLVDGKVITAENYEKREGSIIIQLKSSYLATLPEGEHTLTIRSASGDATTKFTVEAEIVSPPTGSTNVWVWIIIGVVALGVGATVVVFIIRKRKTA